MNNQYLDILTKTWFDASLDAANKFDSDKVNFKLEINNNFLNFTQVGNYYYYIFNLSTAQFEFLSDNITEVLGCSSSITVSEFVNLIHPDDLPYFVNFENKVVEFFHKLDEDNFRKYKVQYDFRVRKSDGNYIRVLHQVIVIDSEDDTRSILKTFGMHTEITHLKEKGKPKLSFIGLDGQSSFIDVEVENLIKPYSEMFTKREHEMLFFICKGLNRVQIGEILGISKHTVDTHRRAILKKSNTKSIAELVSKTMEEGWI